MTDDQVDEVVALLNRRWHSKAGPIGPTHPNDEAGRAVLGMWGAELCRHDYRAVMAAVMNLHRTSKWRPEMSEILDEVRKGRTQAALAESKRLALAPSPDVPVIPPERMRAIWKPVTDETRPTKLKNMARTEQRSGVGGIGGRRRWGAIALLVLCEDLGEGGERGELAANILDEVAKRAR